MSEDPICLGAGGNDAEGIFISLTGNDLLRIPRAGVVTIFFDNGSDFTRFTR